MGSIANIEVDNSFPDAISTTTVQEIINFINSTRPKFYIYKNN